MNQGSFEIAATAGAYNGQPLIGFEFFELVTELETPIDPFERSCVMN